MADYFFDTSGLAKRHVQAPRPVNAYV